MLKGKIYLYYQQLSNSNSVQTLKISIYPKLFNHINELVLQLKLLDRWRNKDQGSKSGNYQNVFCISIKWSLWPIIFYPEMFDVTCTKEIWKDRAKIKNTSFFGVNHFLLVNVKNLYTSNSAAVCRSLSNNRITPIPQNR